MNIPRAVALALLFPALSACVPPQPAPPPPAGAGAAPLAPPPPGLAAGPAPRPATAATTAPAKAPPPDIAPTIIIHEAELFGELHLRAGKTVTMASRLITSRTEPEIGNIGVLFQRTDAQTGDPWVAIADVEVKSKLDKNSRILLTITHEEKTFPPDRKIIPFAPKTRLRLQWQWQ